MNNLYIITGPAGVGKSTICKKISEAKDKSVLIEGDLIYRQVIGGYVSPWKEGNHLDVFWNVCFDMIKTYLSYGYDVIFNYIVTPNVIQKIKEIFSEFNIKFIVLLVDSKELLKRDKQRPIENQMQERCLILLDSFKRKEYNKENILDTTNLSIEDTAKKIEEGDFKI